MVHGAEKLKAKRVRGLCAHISEVRGGTSFNILLETWGTWNSSKIVCHSHSMQSVQIHGGKKQTGFRVEISGQIFVNIALSCSLSRGFYWARFVQSIRRWVAIAVLRSERAVNTCTCGPTINGVTWRNNPSCFVDLCCCLAFCPLTQLYRSKGNLDSKQTKGQPGEKREGGGEGACSIVTWIFQCHSSL